MARKSRSARQARKSKPVQAEPDPAVLQERAASLSEAASQPEDLVALPVQTVTPTESAVVAAAPVAVEQPAPEPGAADRGRRRATLARELADFLVEFSIVLHKRSMYPAGHPHLLESADRFIRRVNALLQARESVTLGVARHRLVIENVATEADNALLRDLAQRLHRHRIGAVHLSRGITLQEIENLLNALCGDPVRGEGPVGKRLDQLGPWPHIKLRPAGYEKLTLQDLDTAPDVGEEKPESPTRDGWIELAQLALADGNQTAEPASDPLVIAEAIGRKSGEVAYDRVVLGYLARVAEESRTHGAAESQLLQRVSKLIQALDQNTLRRLLEAGADHAERRKFVLNASQTLAAEAVIEVVEAAARASHQTISDSLLRLLHKLAHHAEEGSIELREQAEGALRNNVAKLIADWELEDPNPTEYNAILESMVQRASAEYLMTDVSLGGDPTVLIKMALELECTGPAVLGAVETMLARRQLAQLAALLSSAPRSEVTEELWRIVATPERLQLELAASPLDHEAVAILVERIGADAADSLLDCLATADDRSTRAALMKQLQTLGPKVASVAARRLPQAPWYLQRNILVLLNRLGSLPEGFSAETYVAHDDPRIRREAIKLLLESGERPSEAVIRGLTDPDEGIVELALAAALDDCPPEALPLARDIAGDPRRRPEVRALAVRVITRAPHQESLGVLLSIVDYRPRWIWFGRRLAHKSPHLLAALSGLATHWTHDPAVKDVLAYARWHTDRQIRAAATAEAA